MQAYSNPKRESDPYALPDVEVFKRTVAENKADGCLDDDGEPFETGWYWWSCFPGCMPDGYPIGPFESYELALADAQDGNDFEDDLDERQFQRLDDGQ
jgi:hypothetical protein